MDSWTLISHSGLLVVDSKLWTLIFGLLVWTQDFWLKTVVGRLWTVDSWMWIVDCELCFLISQLWTLYSGWQRLVNREGCVHCLQIFPGSSQHNLQQASPVHILLCRISSQGKAAGTCSHSYHLYDSLPYYVIFQNCLSSGPCEHLWDAAKVGLPMYLLWKGIPDQEILDYSSVTALHHEAVNRHTKKMCFL